MYLLTLLFTYVFMPLGFDSIWILTILLSLASPVSSPQAPYTYQYQYYLSPHTARLLPPVHPPGTNTFSIPPTNMSFGVAAGLKK